MASRKVLRGTYYVNKILKKRCVNGQIELLVSWQGYPHPRDNTWEPVAHLPADLVQSFLDKDMCHSISLNKIHRETCEKEHSYDAEHCPSPGPSQLPADLEEHAEHCPSQLLPDLMGELSVEEGEDLQAIFFRELSIRLENSDDFSERKRENNTGLFGKKPKELLSWKSFVHFFFDEHKGFCPTCCKTPFKTSSAFTSHYYRKHIKRKVKESDTCAYESNNNVLVPDLSAIREVSDLKVEDIEDLVKSLWKELEKIFHGETYCQRHEDYKSCRRTQGDLGFQVRFGSFSDEQVNEITRSLTSMYGSGKTKFQDNDYITKVLLPETLVLIYTRLFSCTRDEAEQLLQTRATCPPLLA